MASPSTPSPTPPADPGEIPYPGGTSVPNPTPTPAPAPETTPSSTNAPVPPNEGNNNTPSEAGQLAVTAGGTVVATSSGGVDTSSAEANDGGFHFTDDGTTQDAFAQSLYTLYTGLWGSPPSSKWLTKAIESGDNIWEIENRERTKPAWQHTQAYRDELSQYAFEVAKSLGLM